MNVCIFPGRFQPVHNEHIESFRKTSEYFNCPIIPVQVVVKKDTSPYPPQLLTEMNDQVIQSFPFIHSILQFPNDKVWSIVNVVEWLENDLGFNVIGVGCGSDRTKDYIRQCKYINHPIDVYESNNRDESKCSSSIVRKHIEDKNKKEFKRLVPNVLHKYFDRMVNVTQT